MTEPLPLSLLNDFLYCPRRAALKVVEGWREANVHTDRGDIVHEHSDLAGYESQIRNQKSQILLWRALPVWSERLGLNGRCDIVEVEAAPNQKSEIRNPKSLFPVEFKLGRRRKWDNDDAQLCAQALCLEEMFGVPVLRGAVFHADSKRRREVEFTANLRALTEQAIAGLQALLGNDQGTTLGPKDLTSNVQDSTSNAQLRRLPVAILKPACQECSLYDICLPRATAGDGRPERLARQLFEIS